MARSVVVGILLASAAGACFGQQVQPGDAAAEYPGRAIRITVGFTPGGGPDITARYVAQKLGDAW
jgi:tripartite-type tricarboxylate transporter receptor subunit TctC